MTTLFRRLSYGARALALSGLGTLLVLGAGLGVWLQPAGAATAGNGPILGTGNAYYVTPIYGCTKLGAESTGYVEQHSFTPANCESGYAQFVMNTPYLNGQFTLNLGNTSYSCGLIMSGMVITQINCEPPPG